MKKILHLLTILNLMLLASCVNDAEVRVMPELNCSDTKISLSKEAGATFTSLLSTTEGEVTATCEADWLSIDVNVKRVIYTALTTNDGEDARVAIVKLSSGTYTATVTVRQESKEPDLSLKLGQMIEEGKGMVFWVDATDKQIGKAISVKRLGGYAFEASPSNHNATSVVNGVANSALFTAASENDAVAYCKSLGEGWYLPARDELWELFGVYNGIGYDDPNFISAVPNSLTDAEKSARSTFDKLLTDLQGDLMNTADGAANGDSYWSSTENSAGDKVYWVRFGKSGADVGAKNSTSRFVRCMRTLGDYTFPEEPATLTVNPTAVTLDGASASTATVSLTSNKSSFNITVADDSWLSFSIAGTTVTFTAKSKNTTNAVRSTVATITAGTGTATKSVDITVDQSIASAGSATLELSTNVASILPDAVSKSEVIMMTSTETDFSVVLADESWINVEIDATAKTLYFWSVSPNLNGSNRSTTAIVTAGSGTDVATKQVTITQRALNANEFAVGQVLADNGALKGGIVFWVDATNRAKAKIMSLDRESLAWSTAATPTKTGLTLTSDDGLANTNALAALTNATEMPAIKYCTDRGTGWYWPTKDDLEQMFETYNGTTLAGATAANPDAISNAEKTNRTAWDKVLTGAKAAVMNAAASSETGDSYWACRESSDGTKGFYVRFGKPIAWSSANAAKSSTRYIRAVRSISK